ncbi:MAG: hypothetical protein ACOCTT_01545 [archaeon]
MDKYKEHRCASCNKLLFKYSIIIGKKDILEIETKCNRCGNKKVLEVSLEHLLKLYSDLKDKEENYED